MLPGTQAHQASVASQDLGWERITTLLAAVNATNRNVLLFKKWLKSVVAGAGQCWFKSDPQRVTVFK